MTQTSTTAIGFSGDRGPDPEQKLGLNPEPLGSILARRAERGNEERTTAASETARLLSRVKSLRPDLAVLVAGYNGCGDGGGVEYCGFVPTREQAEAADPWNPPEGFVDAAELLGGAEAAVLCDALDHFPPGGYENNDGGQGVIRVDLATGELVVDHGWNVTDVREELFHFELPEVGGTF